jgi:WD40 repeat protein
MPGTLLLSVLALELALQVPPVTGAPEGGTPRLDRFGDPLPAGALARLGTSRFHRCNCAAYSPDGKVIAAGDSDEVNLWDAATSRVIRRLPLDDRISTVGLIFSHDGKKLAAVGWGGTAVQVWDLATFTKITLSQVEGGSGGGDWGSAAAFSSDDRTLFSATARELFAWDVASGEKRKQMPFLVKDQPARGRMVAFSEDGKVAATQGEEKVYLWDTQTGQLRHEVGTVKLGETMKFSRDGKALIVSGHGHWMNVVDVETGKKARSLPVAGGVVRLAFSLDGKTLAVASNENRNSTSTSGDESIQLWDFTNLQSPPVKFPAPGIHSVTFSPDGKTLAWGCHQQTLCFMDRATGKDVQPAASHRGAIMALAYLPDGKRVASASEDGTIRLWDSETGEALRVLGGHAGLVSGIALFPNGKLLASCGKDGTVRLWDGESGKSLAVRADEGNSVVAVAYSADGKQLASGGYRGKVCLREPATGKILDEIEGGDLGSISGLAFSPDGKALAVLTEHPRKLRLFDTATKKGKEVPIEDEKGLNVVYSSGIPYSPDGKLLAAGWFNNVLLVDTATAGVLRRMPGHCDFCGDLVFSPDGRYLAGNFDGGTRVFEVATDTEIYSFKKELRVSATAFSPDGSRLVVGGVDATALVLDLDNLAGKKRRERLSQKEIAACWECLGETDAGKAYEARADLLHAPASAVSFLAKRLQPSPGLDARRVDALIRKLDSDSFRERDDASAELEHLEELARTPMRKALAAGPPVEARRRLQELLGKLDRFTPSQLRASRAVEILERVGTPEALRVLERLAAGNPEGLLTAESHAAVARVHRRKVPPRGVPEAREIPVAERPPAGPVLPDRHGDPMPAGAIARLGTTRWRLAGEPRRILGSADGKLLAVMNSSAGIDLLDAQTGRNVERGKDGLFSQGFDLRTGVALSADWRKVAAVEAVDGFDTVLVVRAKGRAGEVKIAYRRSKESYPLVPEEVESEGSSSWGNTESLEAVEFSPDGKTLLGVVRFEWHCSGGKVEKEVKETHVIAWDAATGKERWKSPALPNRIHTVVFSPDGKTLTAVGDAGVSLWDAVAGRELRRWPSKEPLYSALYSPDRRWLATGGEGKVLLWEVAAGKVARHLAIPGKEIKAIAFGPDGKLLAAGGDRTIRFWDPPTGKPLGDCPAPNVVEAVAFSGDAKTLFSGHDGENVLRRWDVAGRKPVGEFDSPVTPVRALSFSRDSRTILASPSGEEFYLWEAETGKPCPPPARDDRSITEWLDSSGQAALLRCEDGIGRQFATLLTGKVDRPDELPGFIGSSVDGRRVLVRSEKDKKPCLTVLKVRRDSAGDKDKRKDDVEREFVWTDGNTLSAALSPDGSTVAAAGQNVVCFFDVTTGRERRYQYPTAAQRDLPFGTQPVKYSADGSRVVLDGGWGKVRILAVRDGRRVAEFATKPHHLSGLALSPDGQTLLTTSFNEPAYVWEVTTGQMVRRLEKTASYLFSPDNRTLAASLDAVKLLDLYSGRVVRECEAGGGMVGNFAFSPDSKLLAVCYSDTTITVWPTSPAGAKPGKPLDEQSLARVLESGNAAEAYEAIGRLIADPERAIAFLERRLRAEPRIDAERVERLIAELDGDPPRRDAALKEVARLGTLVEPALRAAASSGKLSPAALRRIEKLLHDLDEKPPPVSAEDLLHVRAVQALERIGTKPARQLLEKLAQGAEASPRTRAAAEALRRTQTH